MDALDTPVPLPLAAVAVVAALALAYYILFVAGAKGAPASKVPPAVVVGGNGAAASGAGDEEEGGEDLKPLDLFYGSQTGTAEGFAKQLEGEARSHGFKARCVDLESFSTDMVTSGGLGVYLMATYGEGDPTDNAIDFMQWMNEDSTPGDATGYSFSVFGLGNRQYEHYNAMGRLVDSKLEGLGATRVYKHGEGDDDGSMDDDWEEWKADLWAALQAASGAAGTEEASADGLPGLPEFKFEASLGPAPKGAKGSCASVQLTPAQLKAVDKSCRPFFEAKTVPVVGNSQLRQAPAQGAGTVHVSLDISGSGLTYGTADNLGVLPVNSTAGARDLAVWCGWDPEAWVTLAPRDPGTPPLFPTPCTVQHALTHYCDLHGPLSKSLVSALAHYATKPGTRAALAALVARDAKAAYHAAVSDRQLSVVEFLNEYGDVKPPLGAFLELVPRLQPRLYTIASSALVQPTTIDIAVSVIDRPKPHGGGRGEGDRRLEGVASTFIACTGQGEEAELGAMALDRARFEGVDLGSMDIVVRPSTFTLPSDPSVPLVLVGPGTGLAPMRAFLQERSAQGEAGEALGEVMLFFGCRRAGEDFIYKEELNAWAEDGTLSALVTAFSREGADKVYVQHRIQERGADVWRLLQGGAHVYVCGATNMGTDVAAAVREVAVQHGDVPAEEVGEWFDSMHKSGRYVSELWSA